MKNLPQSIKLSGDIINFYQDSSTFSKGIFLLASLTLVFLTGFLLYSLYPVLSQMLDKVIAADYSSSLIQAGR